MSKRKSKDTPFEDVVEVVESGQAASEAADQRVDEIRSRAQRQLRRGRLTQLNDRIAGGPTRPGEQKVSRSPFVLGMSFVILGLGIVAAVFYFLLMTESESRRLQRAQRALGNSSYNEAEDLFRQFLDIYPGSKSKELALIGLHSARVRKYSEGSSFTVDSVIQARRYLDEFFHECRDFSGFAEQQEDLIRLSKKITSAAAQVAKEKVSQEALDASEGALVMLDRLTQKNGGVTAEKREELENRQRIAEAAILKSDRLSTSLASIRQTLATGDTIGALGEYTEVIDRFDVIRNDPDFKAVLSEIEAREIEMVVADDIGKEAYLSDPDIDGRPSLSLNLQTQARSDEVSDGELVFGSGGGVVFALDSKTGRPVWRRNVGGLAPFAPVKVDASLPALLLFHSERNELMLVQQTDNALIWRQSIESPASGPPLILNQQIYITTEAGDLWQVAVGTGQAVRRVRFSQPVQGPPAVSRDKASLVIPGRTAFVYTLSLQSLECRAVTWLEYGEGSVGAPLLSMGELFLLCENDSADSSRIRALTFSEGGKLVERQSRRIVGQIWDPCLLRGDELYVPSTPQRLTAFRVSARPDTDALSDIGTNQLENAVFASMFLAAGPGGNLWMASTALRRFRITSQAVALDEVVVAGGQHLYPMQIDDESLLVTTTMPYSASVFFTRVNRNTMTGDWRTVLSTNLVAVGQSKSEKSLIALSDFGNVFRIPVDKLDESGFHTTSVIPFRLPDGLKDPVGGTELPDGRFAAWCYGRDRALWTFTSTGQLERNWGRELPGVMESDPVPLAGGLVVASPGRLTLTATRRRAEDYQVSRDLNAEASWKSMTPISETQLIAINSDNKMVHIQYREIPRPHLAEVAVMSFDGETDLPSVAGGDYLCIATTDGRLLLINSSTLQKVQERDLGVAISHPLRIAADRLFVEIGDDEVHVFELNAELNSVGKFPKNSSQLVDAPLPLPSGGFLAAFSDGTVVNLDVTGLPVGESIRLDMRLQRGPIAVGSSIIVLGIDGSVYSLNDLANH
ncbi:MAG: PQQ-binding-like beta-propeller repeat protein [Fuerstiella sp.]|nr:PQQ-binding-like beta-propeller repeat protein [Fuerstiella sp.]